jgi:hypothetical protein
MAWDPQSLMSLKRNIKHQSCFSGMVFP